MWLIESWMVLDNFKFLMNIGTMNVTYKNLPSKYSGYFRVGLPVTISL
jgi:hypothetical protein